MATTKVYEEGNKGFYIFPITDSSYVKTAEDYGTAVHIKGLISVEGTVEQTENKLAADDDPAYLTRRSPATITGTLTIVGLDEEGYKALYGTAITDKNGALLFGASGEPNKVGFVFFNEQHSIDGVTDTLSVNAHIFYNVTFSLPNISTTTKAEDSTDTRPFELSFTASSVGYGENGSICTYACLNSKKSASQFTTAFENWSTGGSITMYIPEDNVL